MPDSLRLPSLTTAWLALGLCAVGRSHSATTPAAELAPAPAAEKPAPAAATPADVSPDQPKRSRVMSDHVAATVVTGLPKYTPEPQPGEPEKEPADTRETDWAMNRIIRLPKYVVKEPKPPVFTERQLHTKKGLADLARKSHRGLKLGNFLGMNEALALQMYAEQERLDNMAKLADEAKDARNAGDSAGAEALARERIKTFYRPSDIGGGRGR